MSEPTRSIFDQIASWPAEDQEELAEFARDIEARRTGIYLLNNDERSAINGALKSRFASDAEVEAFWARRNLA